MTFFEAINSCLKNYATFKGRAPRSEYWFWTLFLILTSTCIQIIDLNILFAENRPLTGIFNLLTFIPSLAVYVRRLHDVNRSGYWIFLAFTVIGLIPLLYWCVTKGTTGSNDFGEDPLQNNEPTTTVL